MRVGRAFGALTLALAVASCSAIGNTDDDGDGDDTSSSSGFSGTHIFYSSRLDNVTLLPYSGAVDLRTLAVND